MNKNFLNFVRLILFILIIINISACSTKKQKEEIGDLKYNHNNKEVIFNDEISSLVENFINNHLLLEDSRGVVSVYDSIYGLYHLKTLIDKEEEIDFFITKDAELFFPYFLNIDKILEAKSLIIDQEIDLQAGEIVSPQAAKKIAEDFVNYYLFLNNSSVPISIHETNYDLYNLKIYIEPEEIINSFITKDAKLFFPQSINIKSLSN